MAHPCDFKVTGRVKGERGQKTLAKFAEFADAYNWAAQVAGPRVAFNPDIRITVYDRFGRVFASWVGGKRLPKGGRA